MNYIFADYFSNAKSSDGTREEEIIEISYYSVDLASLCILWCGPIVHIVQLIIYNILTLSVRDIHTYCL